MKAAVLRAPGERFEITDLTLRALGPRDVHVQIAASGVCRSDLSIQDGTIPHPLPAVLGHEGAGVVLATGAEVTTVAPGDHVVLSWVAPCRACFQCLHGHPELCEHGIDHAFAAPYATDPNGDPLLAAFGTATFGEETILPEAACIKIDRAFPLDLAALVGCGVVTGVGAVCNSAHVESGRERGGRRLRRRGARRDPGRAPGGCVADHRGRPGRVEARPRTLVRRNRGRRRVGRRRGRCRPRADRGPGRRPHARGRRHVGDDPPGVRHGPPRRNGDDRRRRPLRRHGRDRRDDAHGRRQDGSGLRVRHDRPRAATSPRWCGCTAQAGSISTRW